MFRKAFVIVFMAVCVVVIEMNDEPQQENCLAFTSSSVNIAVTGHRNSAGHWISQVVVGEANEHHAANLDVDVQYREKKTCDPQEESRSDIVLTFSVPPANRDSIHQHYRHRQVRPVSVYDELQYERRPKYPPSGYLGFKDVGYFKAYLTPVSWATARHQCNEDGGHLASITTLEKLTFVKSLNALGHWLWMDVHEAGVNNVYYNVTGGVWQLPSSMTWYAGRPSYKGGADCLMLYISDGRVADVPCESEKHTYVCEIPWYWGV